MRFVLSGLAGMMRGKGRYGASRPLRKPLAKLAMGAALLVVLGTGWGAVAPAAAGPLRLVALGDSLTQGYGLPPEEGLTAQLQAWLAARGEDVVVINAGVSGDTTAGGRARMGWTLAEGADALIVALGGNDLLRGLDPAMSRANLAAILDDAAARGIAVLLIPIEAPGNYGPAYSRSFDAIFPDLARREGVMLGTSFLDPLMKTGDPADVVRELLQSDGLHPSAKGVQRIVEVLGPEVRALLARVRGG
jgi:acyl-CoA thioesterase-1